MVVHPISKEVLNAFFETGGESEIEFQVIKYTKDQNNVISCNS